MSEFPSEIAEQLASRGYVPCDGGVLDAACTALVRAHMEQPAPPVDVLLKRLQEKSRETLVYPDCSLTGSHRVRGWIPPETIYQEVGRYPLERVAQYAHVHANDLELMLDASQDLWVDLIPTPWPRRYVSSITTNGNHRSAVYYSLSLPLIPAHIEVKSLREFVISPDAMDCDRLTQLTDSGWVRILDTSPNGFVTVRDQSNGAWAWFSDTHGAINAKALETRFAEPLPEPYRRIIRGHSPGA